MLSLFVLGAFVCFIGGCDVLSELGNKTKKANSNSQISGRFSLLQVLTSSPDQKAPIILRIDSATGETWVFELKQNRWIEVEDELKRIGTYNPKTKKIELGVQTVDGRDLNELSKEELVRYLSATIRNGNSPTPEDPLGIR
ncbi:MAG: hypothetical protein WC180_02900 [Candidatus Paceibacterota bacterium]